MVVLLGAACGGPGPVRLTNVPVPAASLGAACEALVRALPSSLGAHLDRRTLKPAQATAVAYGRGPAVLTCGAAGVPASYRPDATLSFVDDVGWFSERIGDGLRFSTPTRSPHVVLSLPATTLADVQPFDVLVTVGAAVRAHTRATTA
ncbi:DUF3515 domain-containing protein [Frankia sp. Ag45/Mut15]|uniref:DUF3515 domain-containing protein n=1 Tax=Frankia umida TaxID=573489 RepID=A0ABT0JX76_9ACTN|nr:DUF3515 family protein [Frankia umida]MCK9876151.1 DUF3515 domain-containing protein [Frankia umida]